MTTLAALAHVARTTTALAVELALIVTEAACEMFLDARRGPSVATVIDWRDGE